MLQKLYSGDGKSFLEDIDQQYRSSKYAIVNFLYFANAMQYKLLEPSASAQVVDPVYAAALKDSTFLLPDGIALQVRNRCMSEHKKWLHNLNGTDLTPAILEYFTSRYKVTLYIYSVYDEKIQKDQSWLQKAVRLLQQQFALVNIHAYQSHYTSRGKDYPWTEMASIVDLNVCNIFLNCTGSPFQEKWILEHKQWFMDHNMLVLNVGGFLDFYSGFEKRAPKRVVQARVGEALWRVVSNPKKNAKKFLSMFGVFGLLWRHFISKLP